LRTDRVIDAMTTIIAESHLLRSEVEDDQGLTQDDRDALLRAARVISAQADTILEWLIVAPLDVPKQ
jgi:hypothetical protein